MEQEPQSVQCFERIQSFLEDNTMVDAAMRIWADASAIEYSGRTFSDKYGRLMELSDLAEDLPEDTRFAVTSFVLDKALDLPELQSFPILQIHAYDRQLATMARWLKHLGEQDTSAPLLVQKIRSHLEAGTYLKNRFAKVASLAGFDEARAVCEKYQTAAD